MHPRLNPFSSSTKLSRDYSEVSEINHGKDPYNFHVPISNSPQPERRQKDINAWKEYIKRKVDKAVFFILFLS
jgi:hypothetical protein